MLLIDPEARKHQADDGFTDDDIRHAVRNAIRTLPPYLYDGPDDSDFFIGPDGSGDLLEVIVLAAIEEDDEPLAIHAMRRRKKFYPYL